MRLLLWLPVSGSESQHLPLPTHNSLVSQLPSSLLFYLTLPSSYAVFWSIDVSALASCSWSQDLKLASSHEAQLTSDEVILPKLTGPLAPWSHLPLALSLSLSLLSGWKHSFMVVSILPFIHSLSPQPPQLPQKVDSFLFDSSKQHKRKALNCLPASWISAQKGPS